MIMNEKKCVECGIKEHIELFINPYNSIEKIYLCQLCAHKPFNEFFNRDFMKPWWERK